MQYLLTTLHSTFNAYPLGMKLAVLGVLAFGWIVGHTRAEYAEALKRRSGSVVLPTICSHLALLLGVGMIADGMWSHSYRSVIVAAGALLGMLFTMALCRRLARNAAHRVLLAAGYERPAMPIFPKQRGS